MQRLDDYYKILQVHNLAEPEVIESAYKRLARKYHPDLNDSKDALIRMQKINEAYETLSDPGKRKEYDAYWIRNQNNVRNEPEKQPDMENALPAKKVIPVTSNILKIGIMNKLMS